MTPATIVKEPSQSTALSPFMSGVFGVWISRQNSMMMKARPSNGKLIQKHHLLRSVCNMSFLSLKPTSN
jgi:hypothetical protein